MIDIPGLVPVVSAGSFQAKEFVVRISCMIMIVRSGVLSFRIMCHTMENITLSHFYFQILCLISLFTTGI